MRVIQSIVIILGRICLSGLFIISAIYKVIDWQATERGLVSLICDWHAYVSFSASLQKFFSALLPWVPVVLVIITVLELIGGLLVLFGIKPRLGAFFLILFFIPATILVHQFWFLEGIKREMQMILFTKNIAILGGLLYILGFGGSIEKKRGPEIQEIQIDTDV